MGFSRARQGAPSDPRGRMEARAAPSNWRYTLAAMDSAKIQDTLFIVTGACLRAERLDRPLAGRVKERAEVLLRARGHEEADVVILSDIWYLNAQELHRRPTISVGGPGVNHLAAFWQGKLRPALVVEHVFQIQMDVRGHDFRCSVWGMDHDTTVEAVDTFIEKGHLERFLKCFPPALS